MILDFGSDFSPDTLFKMSQAITWKVPENLYRELVWAQQELKYPLSL